jgi:hypothetical protein
MDLGNTKVVEIVTNYFFIMINFHNLRKQGKKKKITKNFQIPNSRHETVSMDVLLRKTIL